WAACAPTSLLIPECAGGSYAVGLGGTSMAAPHVAGLAALIVEDIGHGKPSRVKTILQQSADDLGTPGTDPQYGKGRINVAKALGLQ
ncbi:MAG TPA: S8 family serine peptidase, partial [Thermoanaerobaculia bacterium]